MFLHQKHLDLKTDGKNVKAELPKADNAMYQLLAILFLQTNLLRLLILSMQPLI